MIELTTVQRTAIQILESLIIDDLQANSLIAVKSVHVWFVSVVVAAKWRSLLRHVLNLHVGHGELFNECGHPDLDPEKARKKKWLKAGGSDFKEHFLCFVCKDARTTLGSMLFSTQKLKCPT